MRKIIILTTVLVLALALVFCGPAPKPTEATETVTTEAAAPTFDCPADISKVVAVNVMIAAKGKAKLAYNKKASQLPAPDKKDKAAVKAFKDLEKSLAAVSKGTLKMQVPFKVKLLIVNQDKKAEAAVSGKVTQASGASQDYSANVAPKGKAELEICVKDAGSFDFAVGAGKLTIVGE